jgi:hypothetical protein
MRKTDLAPAQKAEFNIMEINMKKTVVGEWKNRGLEFLCRSL